MDADGLRRFHLFHPYPQMKMTGMPYCNWLAQFQFMALDNRLAIFVECAYIFGIINIVIITDALNRRMKRGTGYELQRQDNIAVGIVPNANRLPKEGNPVRRFAI